MYSGFVIAALLTLGSILSCFLNPHPLVVEPDDAFEWPSENLPMASKNLAWEF